ncbi:MAG TPA: M20/M25/M40 family metallo-hydrolase [Longimicrobiales bacterium]|nr:M20/M25/M40 family metallo-hydrolase [Longimicrobiales bacterium]
MTSSTILGGVLAASAAAAIAGSVQPLVAQSARGGLGEEYRAVADSLIAAALGDDDAWQRLAEMVDRFGPRLSGSDNLERALDWILEGMSADGLENVRAQPVTVPHWVRNDESLRLVEPTVAELPMLGLGGSVGTPSGGITAEVLVVDSFEDLERRADDARGRIVLFDVPFTTYGETVQYRTGGAVAAARAGAVASLIRSVTPYSMRTPHTGVMRYEEGVAQIPHAAITVEDALRLRRIAERGRIPVVHLEMGAETLPDATSRNVMAEIVGRERPDEIVVLGGHIDSWDVGDGAMDDGGGSVVAWEAVRLMKELGLRPRRTVRVVLWTNEENGLRGARAYADELAADAARTVLAIESDAGVFRPLGFGFTGTDEAYEIVRAVGGLLDKIGAGEISRGGGGADIGPLMQTGVPGMGLRVDGTRYFWYHHSPADTMDKLDPHEMALCVAAMAVMAYVVADLDDPLPRQVAEASR